MREPRDTAVLLLIFNRPALVERLIEGLRAVRPTSVWVSADGPRYSHPDDVALCRAARETVERIDWPCEVHRSFHDRNLGCREAVSTGISWFLDANPEGIILEDDCLPDPSFFRFCTTLLERYGSDPRVASISGANPRGRGPSSGESYYFSRYPRIWGWATWRRAWASYDPAIVDWPEFRRRGHLAQFCDTRRGERFWRWTLDEVHRGRLDTWDYQWTFACWKTRSLSVTPDRNLVSNIGFGPEATHAQIGGSWAAEPTAAMPDELRHPPFLVRDAEADRITERAHFSDRPLALKAARRIARTVRRTATS